MEDHGNFKGELLGSHTLSYVEWSMYKRYVLQYYCFPLSAARSKHCQLSEAELADYNDQLVQLIV